MQDDHSKREKNWVLGVAALTSFMVALDAMVLTSALAIFSLCGAIAGLWLPARRPIIAASTLESG